MGSRLETVGLGIQQRLTYLLIFTLTVALACVIATTTLIYVVITRGNASASERRKIDERNVEATILTVECVSKYRTEYVDLRACMKAKLPSL